jgi:exosortase A-associated hydrolase 1
MSRLHFDFGCGSLKLAGVLDTAPGTTGLLIVSGGNEIRSGAFSGQSLLAARIAARGFPTFRFDRRGIGDSEGENRGFESSEKDILAAIEAFRAICPRIKRMFAFGNCDAASALMLARGAGCDGLILSNPWTIEDSASEEDSAPPPSAIRSRYAAKLKNPRELARLLSGGVDLRKLAGGVLRSLRSEPGPSTLAQAMQAGLAQFEGHVSILLATADRTAQVFENAWDSGDPRIHRCDGAGHAYVEPAHCDWLDARILAALRA